MSRADKPKKSQPAKSAESSKPAKSRTKSSAEPSSKTIPSKQLGEPMAEKPSPKPKLDRQAADREAKPAVKVTKGKVPAAATPPASISSKKIPKDKEQLLLELQPKAASVVEVPKPPSSPTAPVLPASPAAVAAKKALKRRNDGEAVPPSGSVAKAVPAISSPLEPPKKTIKTGRAAGKKPNSTAGAETSKRPTKKSSPYVVEKPESLELGAIGSGKSGTATAVPVIAQDTIATITVATLHEPPAPLVLEAVLPPPVLEIPPAAFNEPFPFYVPPILMEGDVSGIFSDRFSIGFEEPKAWSAPAVAEVEKAKVPEAIPQVAESPWRRSEPDAAPFPKLDPSLGAESPIVFSGVLRSQPLEKIGEPQAGQRLAPDGEVWLHARDPYCLYCCWSYRAEDLAAYAAFVGGEWQLRIYSTDDFLHPKKVTRLPLEAEHAFVLVDQPGAMYVAELGVARLGLGWETHARSNRVATPAVVENPVVSDSPPLSTQYGQPDRQLDTPKERLARFQWSPVVVPTASFTPESAPNFPEWQSSVISRPQAVETIWRLAGTEIRGGPSSADVISTVGIEISSLASIPAEIGGPEMPGGSSELLASAAQPQAPGVPGSVPWPADVASRDFWLRVNAELIIYGSTDRAASVSIGGRPVRLRQDGSFSFRFALPDGQYPLPVVALSPDGLETRSAALQFSRTTEFHGQVGVHPPEVARQPPSTAALG